MRHIRIGLIGGGFIGKTHAMAFAAAPVVFGGAARAKAEMVAEADEDRARHAAAALGFPRWTADWRALVRDPGIDVVAIATPNQLHREMALAAIAAGKHVYCEKPLGLDAVEAEEMTRAAEAAGVRTLVGFNYLCNPLIGLARDLVAAGELGEIWSFRGTHNEDFLADPAIPFSWRCDRRLAGTGALGDLGSHIVSFAHYLVGDIARVNGRARIVIAERGAPGGGRRAVETDDHAAFLVEFANGATGTIEASRVAQGRKLGLGFEINGAGGSLLFDQERPGELKLYSAADPKRARGFRTILAGPEHADYAAFCPAPGHGLGYGDLKTIEVQRLVRGIAEGAPLYPDFRAAWRVAQVIDAVLESSGTGAWAAVPPCSMP